MSKKQAADLGDEVITLPGRVVNDLEPYNGLRIVATVYPMGFNHLGRFQREVGAILTAIMDSGLDVGKLVSRDGKEDPEALERLGNKMLMRALPYVVTSAIDMLSECVTIEVVEAPDGWKRDGEGNLRSISMKTPGFPHWWGASLAEVWIEESFAGGKWRPWVTAIERTVKSLTGKTVSILGMLSKRASAPGTPST